MAYSRRNCLSQFHGLVDVRTVSWRLISGVRGKTLIIEPVRKHHPLGHFMEVFCRRICFGALPLTLILAATVSAGPGLDHLRGTLIQLDAELSSQPDRQQRWKEFYGHDELQRQLANGDSADVESVDKIRRQFFAAEQEIPRTRLRVLSQSLNRWASQIEDESALQAAVIAYDEVLSVIRRQRRLTSIWNSFFRGEEIQALLDEEVDADPAAVQAAVERLRGEVELPNRENFSRVRRALTHWIAEIENPVQGELAIAARREKFNYQPVDSRRLQKSRGRLVHALRRLDSFLSRDADKARVWKKYLHWEPLLKDLRGTDRPSLAVLSAAYGKFNSGEPGMELDYFDDAEDALKQYLELLLLAETAPHRVAQSKQDLVDAVDALGRYLIGGGERKEKAWKEFLAWDDLQEELAKEQPDGRVLRRVLDRYRSGEEGLDIQPFQLVERRIRKHMELQLARRNQDRDIYAAQLEELAIALEQHRTRPTVDSAAEVIKRMTWLQGAGQADLLISRIRDVYMRPNLVIRAPGKLFTQRLNSTQSRRTPISRCFEGAWVTGQARTSATINGHLLPFDDGILVEVVLSGEILTQSVGRKRKVNVCSRGTTRITGRKQLVVTLDGVSDWPAVAAAHTTQNITGVNVNRKLGQHIVSKVATRKAWESTPRAANEANQEARATVARQMDEQARHLVQRANEQLQERVSAPLRAEGLYPDLIHMRSTRSDVQLVARINRNDFLTSPSDPPALATTDDEVSLRVHQSAINNQLAERFRDRKIDNDIVLRLLKENDLQVPDELKPVHKTDGSGEVEPPEEWSLTFDSQQPVEISFEGDLIRVGVMGRHFTREGREIQARMRISAAYSVHQDGKHMRFNRETDVEVDFVESPDRLTTMQLAYKTFMLRKVGSLFPETISTAELPQGQPIDLLGTFNFKSISTAAGWLAIDAEVDTEALMAQIPLEE